MKTINEIEYAKREAEDLLKIIPPNMRVHKVLENLLELLEYRTEERDELQRRIDQVSKAMMDGMELWTLTGHFPALIEQP